MPPSRANRIALSIANSPLVKTAIGGEDANWGRIVMAVGKAGEPAERDQPVDLLRPPSRGSSRVSAILPMTRLETSAYMRGERRSTSRVDLGLGVRQRRQVYTCDLTKAYIEINGDYRS